MRIEAVRAGVGVALLPCYAGDSDPLLERVTAPVSELAADYWSSCIATCVVPLACAPSWTGSRRCSPGGDALAGAG